MEDYNDCLLGLSYASTNDADDEKKDSFYQSRKERYNDTLGDYNAKIGAENTGTVKSWAHKDWATWTKTARDLHTHASSIIL